jgi:hypothetical protein
VGDESVQLRHLGCVLDRAVLLLITMPVAGHVARIDGDPSIGRFIMVAAVVKLVVGAGLRYWMAFTLYDGTDPQRYHLAGKQLAPLFRSGDFSNLGEISGTRFIEILTGTVYALTGATRLGAFLVYSWFAFIGLVLIYKAVRLAYPDADHGRYRLLLFFFPTLVFWPSSIGKEAWMLLCIGAIVFGVASIATGRWQGLVWAALGMWGAAVVRPHVALLLAVAALAAVPVRLWRRPVVEGVTRGRGAGVLLLLFIVAASALLVGRASSFFDLESLNSETAQSVLTRVEGQTGQGGSAFDAPSPSNPLGFAQATVTVLFRPLLFEAHNMQSVVSALEGMLLLGVIALSLTRLRRLPSAVLQVPFVMLALVYTAGFIYGFASIENFGILARQRAQLLPIFFVLLAGAAPASTRLIRTRAPRRAAVAR